MEALEAIPEKDRKGSLAQQGLGFFTKLFATEAKLQQLSPGERAKKRLEPERPILDALLAWAETKAAAP